MLVVLLAVLLVPPVVLPLAVLLVSPKRVSFGSTRVPSFVLLFRLSFRLVL